MTTKHKSETIIEKVIVKKLIPGGQGLATLASGKKVFIWGVLPEEEVLVEVLKSRSKFAEARVVEVITPAKTRVEVRDPESYLATSPWQIMSIRSENAHKKKLLKEIFAQHDIALSEFSYIYEKPEYEYRNKMEYSFYGDEKGVHLALYSRGTHQKIIIGGSSLAQKDIDQAARALLKAINKVSIRASDLKSVVVRRDQEGNVVCVLFVKSKELPVIEKPKEMSGLIVYFSNPKSPASVPTKQLYTEGLVELKGKLLNKTFTYSPISFFQVHIPIFERALATIKKAVDEKPVVDMYAGVGSIGLSLDVPVTLVELDEFCVDMAEKNMHEKSEIIHASSENALDYITPERTVIVDPPRSGLHRDVTDQLTLSGPKKVIYLSCNPATQARDIALLGSCYKIVHFEGYNFFPHTPHIESLAILERI